MDSRPARAWSALSEREREVVRLSAEGLTDFAVGEQLGLAAETVRSHWKRVRKRLGDISRAEVVRMLAHEEGNPYRDVFDALGAPVFIGDRSGFYIDVNPAALSLLGYRREEMVGQNYDRFIPQGTEVELAQLRRTLYSEGAWEGDFPMVRKDGSTINLHWRSRIDPRSGRIVGIALP